MHSLLPLILDGMIESLRKPDYSIYEVIMRQYMRKRKKPLKIVSCKNRPCLERHHSQSGVKHVACKQWNSLKCFKIT